MIFPELGRDVAWLSWGRLRYAHTQGIMLGWLSNAFLAFLYHAVPILTGRPVTSRRLGLWLFGLWNLATIAPGWVLVLAGISQPLEWAEFPLVVDALVVVANALALVQFLPGFFARGLESLYVSSWYVIGALIFTLFAYPMGNLVPEVVAGASGAAFSGLWIHDAIGLYVTPLALAIIYFVIPASTRRPIYSHFLSMLGFWLLFFLYPLNGTHHYVFSVIPMPAQVGAIAASALLGVTVVIVVTNLFLSMRGAGWLARDPGLRFVAASTLFYLVVSVQGALQAQMALNQTVHFTDWVIGHSHMAMLGFASFAAAGGLIHAWQRIAWARYNARAIRWSFWLLVAGMVTMFVDLTAAGVVQGRMWETAAPWIDSIVATRPFWIVRTVSGLVLTAGFVVAAPGPDDGAGGGGPAGSGHRRQRGPPAGGDTQTRARGRHGGLVIERPQRALRMSYIVASVAGFAFFALSVVLLGLWPKRVLEAQAKAMGPEYMLELSDSARRGRRVYGREGCAYCHTQQVRYLHADMARFGAPTLAWETRPDTPHLWGTRRIGPDLTRAGGTRPQDWHFAHLFSPRAMVPDSVMPPYRALFDGAPDRPRQEARDLGGLPRVAGPRPRAGRARRRGPRQGRLQLSRRCDEADGVRGRAQRSPGEGAACSRRPAAATREQPAPRATAVRAALRHLPRCQRRRRRGRRRHPPSAAPKPGRARVLQPAPRRGLVERRLRIGHAGMARPDSSDDRAALAQAVRALAASPAGAEPSAAHG